jgi:hypothetical protein
MKRAILASILAASLAATAVLALAAPPKPPPSPADAPVVPSLATLMEKDLRWGMSHQEVTDAYNKINGLFDREYAPQIAKLQPGVEQQQLEADRESRKVNFQRSYTPFGTDPTGYDVTALHLEYTYKNNEAVQRLFKEGKTRYFFFIKDRFWKMYDEIPLKADAPLGGSFQDAVGKLNTVFGVAGRVIPANPAQGIERNTVDWQDTSNHLRAIDRSSEHLVGLVLCDKNTERNLDALRINKPTDPFALDPSIAAITKSGVSDPNAAKPGMADAGAGKGKKK